MFSVLQKIGGDKLCQTQRSMSELFLNTQNLC